jgi:hypothetical protein
MRDEILKCVDHGETLFSSGTNAWAYRWFHNIGSFAVTFPNVSELWTTWWAMETVGSAIGVLQYASCLMYDETSNPVFAPWTPLGGGGPPELWEKEGLMFEVAWLPENVSFLRDALSAEYVVDRMRKAASLLPDGENHRISQQMLSDVLLQRALLEARIAELPVLLERRCPAAELLKWTR